MKSTGIIRRVDDLGRVVIPKEIRRALNIREGDPLELHVERDMVCLKRYFASDAYAETIANVIRNMEDDFDCTSNMVSAKRKLHEAVELLKQEEE